MLTYDQTIQELASRHGISPASVAQLAEGLKRTGGGQVQFDVPEFGGMGQWMPGMVMAGDMFNHTLKERLHSICSDIAQCVRSGALAPAPNPANGSAPATVTLRWPAPAHWWPGDLGDPASSGSQNDLRYAWFPSSRRLAVDLRGSVWVYDTADHQISGVSQQQSGAGITLTFTSQHGVIELSRLPVMGRG